MDEAHSELRTQVVIMIDRKGAFLEVEYNKVSQETTSAVVVVVGDVVLCEIVPSLLII